MTTTQRILRLFRSLLGLFKIKAASPRLLDLTREYLENEIKENRLTESTRKKYDTIVKNLELFLHSRRELSLTVVEVKIKFAVNFKNYLHKNLKSCSLTHAAKHVETVDRVLDYAVNQEIIPYNPLASYKCKRDKVKDVVHLDVSELKRLKGAIFVNQIYNTVRDFYLFQCFTGLSYMDLWLYQIVTDDGIIWVTCNQGRGKTKKKYWTELTADAQVIHDKYGGKFPKMDNRTYNRIIKEIMAQIGVHKHITTHTGRKTFATLKDQEGYSVGTIAAMLGNTEEIARKHYIDPSKERVKREIFKLKIATLQPGIGRMI
jgi:integrase/recombinase XerD